MNKNENKKQKLKYATRNMKSNKKTKINSIEITVKF